MIAEPIDPAAVKAEHEGDHACLAYIEGAPVLVWYVTPHQGKPCLPYRLAVEAEHAEEDARDQRARAVAAEVRADAARVEAERLAGKVAQQYEQMRRADRAASVMENEALSRGTRATAPSRRRLATIRAALADQPKQMRRPLGRVNPGVCTVDLDADQPEQVQPEEPRSRCEYGYATARRCPKRSEVGMNRCADHLGQPEQVKP